LPRARDDERSAAHRGIADPAPLGRLQLAALGLLAVAFALGVGAATALASFLVEAGVHDGLSRGAAGLLAALGGGSGIVARVVVGFAADRRGGRHLRVVAAMLACGAVGYALLAVGSAAALAAGAVLAYGLGWGWNGLFNFAVVRTHPGAPGRATGITQAGGRIGGVLGPLAFGFVAAGVSFRLAWAATAVAALLAAGGMLLGRRLVLAARAAAGTGVPGGRPAATPRPADGGRLGGTAPGGLLGERR
jgi:MFS family permease